MQHLFLHLCRFLVSATRAVLELHNLNAESISFLKRLTNMTPVLSVHLLRIRELVPVSVPHVTRAIYIQSHTPSLSKAAC